MVELNIVIKRTLIAIVFLALPSMGATENFADEANAAARAYRAAADEANAATDPKAKAGHLVEAAKALDEFAANQAKIASVFADMAARDLARLTTAYSNASMVSGMRGGSKQSKETLQETLLETQARIVTDDARRAVTADDAANANVAASMAKSDADEARQADIAALAAPAGSASEKADVTEVARAVKAAREEAAAAETDARKARADFAGGVVAEPPPMMPPGG